MIHEGQGHRAFKQFNVCKSEHFAVPRLFPPLTIPLYWRKKYLSWEEFGNVKNGKMFLYEALKEKVALLGPELGNELVLDRKIIIIDKDDNEVMRLDEQVLRPSSLRGWLKVTETNLNFHVSLVKPPAAEHMKSQPLDEMLELKVFFFFTFGVQQLV